MFDHVTIRVSDRTASERFYESVLQTLGIEQKPTFGKPRAPPWLERRSLTVTSGLDGW
jgi:catechol 2,3-dioxygenase-like lactoylglutathione lyase family enzyme